MFNENILHAFYIEICEFTMLFLLVKVVDTLVFL